MPGATGVIHGWYVVGPAPIGRRKWLFEGYLGVICVCYGTVPRKYGSVIGGVAYALSSSVNLWE